MNYLLDKKNKKNNLLKILIAVFILVALFYFRSSIFRGLSYVTHSIFSSILVFGNNVGEKLSNTEYFFSSKKTLLQENEDLRSQLDEMSAKIINYNSILDENNKLKEILGRSETEQMILAGILAKPNQSPYDTLVIDVGEREGVLVGKKVFVLGSVPIGRVSEVFQSSSKVVLFSTPKEKTDVIISGKDIFMQAIGRGGGNFEMILPRDIVLENGTEIILPGITPYVLGIVQSVLSDPRDAYQKALLVSPVNVQEIKFVQVEK